MTVTVPPVATSWSTVRCHGTWTDLDGLTRIPGGWSLSIPTDIRNSAQDIIIPAFTKRGNLSTANGLPSIDLNIPVVDDPDNLPASGFAFTLTISLKDGGERKYLLAPTYAQATANQQINLRLESPNYVAPPTVTVRTLAVPAGAQDGQVPAWDGATGRLVWVDPATGGGVSDYGDLLNVPDSFPTTSGQVTDATVTGRSLLTAASQAAARAAIGAGISNLALGTTSTTAKAGDYQPAWADVTSKPTTFPPTIGATSTTSVAGNDARLADARDTTAARITDATTVGRSVVTAADAATARTAIGAGTSNLAIGTTSTTAAAGNDSRLSDARAPLAHSAGLITSGTLDAARLNTYQRIAFVDYSAGAAPAMPAGTLWIVTGAPADDTPVPSWVPAPALLFRSGS